MTAGDRVVIKVGRRAGEAGTVTGVYREKGCGCSSVVVRLDARGEWAGKASEVRRL